MVWNCGSETELDAEWVFEKVTGVPPMARYGATRLQGQLPLQSVPSGCLLHGFLLHSFHVWLPAFGPSVVACGVLNYSFCSPGFEIDSAENLMWGSEMSNNVPSFDFKAITSSLRHQLQLCSSLVNRGIVLVRGASSRNRASTLKEICHGVFQAESVHHSFQVRCTSEDENTLKGIPLHSERAFSETEPGWCCDVTFGQRHAARHHNLLCTASMHRHAPASRAHGSMLSPHMQRASSA